MHLEEPNVQARLKTILEAKNLDSFEPVIKYMPGWKEDISSCDSLVQLPDNAKSYISYLEELLDHEIQFISVGAERDQYLLKGE